MEVKYEKQKILNSIEGIPQSTFLAVKKSVEIVNTLNERID